MSFCEHMLEGPDYAGQTPEEKLLNIQNELVWGLTYRNFKENEKHKPMMPMHSPINIPFELCRAETLLRGKKKAYYSKSREAGPEEDPAGVGDGADKQPPVQKPKTAKKRKISIDKQEKPSLLDRNVWTQSKYMDYLSIPSPKFYEEPKDKKYKKRCELEPCPPRFIQLAVPNKRRVFANWKDYAHFLPTEMLMRYEEILHTDQNLEPREARYYYKKLDREKRKKLKKKRRLAKKKKLEKEKDFKWLNEQIDMLAKDIMDYIEDEPLFTLNYKQMLLSDGILDRLETSKLMKKPSRKTKNDCKKTIIEVSDKFAIWIDTLTRFVDVQAIESDEDIPPLSISSLSEESEGEGEGESDYDYTTEDELRDDQLFEPTEGMWGEEGGPDGMGGLLEERDAEAFMEDIFRPGEGEGAAELDEMINNLDGDALDKLVKILSNCSDEFLDREIETERMPEVKYRDVLDRLKELRDALLAEDEGKPFLEKIMIDWALQNDPDNVDDEILRKIHDVAGLLGDVLTTKKPGQEGIGEGGRPGEQERGADIAGEGEPVEAGTGEGVAGEGVPGEVSEAEGGPGEGGATEGADQVGAEGSVAQIGPEGSVAQVGAEGSVAQVGAEGSVAQVGPEGSVAQVGAAEGGTAEGGAAEEGDAGGGIEGGEDVGAEGVAGAEGGPGKGVKGKGAKKPPGAKGAEEVTPSTSTGGALSDQGPSRATLMDDFDLTDTEGGLTTPGLTDLEGEEGIGAAEYVPSVVGPAGELPPGSEKEIAVLYRPGGPEFVPTEGMPAEGRAEGKVIKGHKPPSTFEHSPDTVCCLSLKTWAVWLLEITHNAHNWTQWMSCVIQKVREYASIVRGDVREPNGQIRVLRKAEWRKFIKETEESVVAWRQYSAHVKDLSQSIIDNFHDKKVNCCPKCLEDHLITNVVVAHDTLQALTEAISCAAYWQRCLDNLVDKTCSLAQTTKEDDTLAISSDESVITAELEEVESKTEESGESVYEIEGFEAPVPKENVVET